MSGSIKLNVDLNEWVKFSKYTENPNPVIYTPRFSAFLTTLIQSFKQKVFWYPIRAHREVELCEGRPTTAQELINYSKRHEKNYLEGYLISRKINCPSIASAYLTLLQIDFMPATVAPDLHSFFSLRNSFLEKYPFNTIQPNELSEIELRLGPMFHLRHESTKNTSLVFHNLLATGFDLFYQAVAHSIPVHSVQVWPLAIPNGSLKTLLRSMPQLKHLELQGGTLSMDDFEPHETLEEVHFFGCSILGPLEFPKNKFPQFIKINIYPKIDLESRISSLTIKGILEHPSGEFSRKTEYYIAESEFI